MKKIFTILMVLLRQTQDTIEYKQIQVYVQVYGMPNKLKISEDNEDGSIIVKKEIYTSQMQALKTYTSQGWEVVAMNDWAHYLLKRKRSIKTK